MKPVLRSIVAVGALLGLASCAYLLNQISTTVAPVVGAAAPQLKLTCHDSSSGRCYFRYVDVATKAKTEHSVAVGASEVVPDIAAPATLCIWISPVEGACPVKDSVVGPKGSVSFSIRH